MQDTEWKDGQLKRVGVKQNAAVMKQARLGWACRVWAPEREGMFAALGATGLEWNEPSTRVRSGRLHGAIHTNPPMGVILCVSLQIEQCQKGARQGRLYVTDGSMPDYEVQQYPQDAPGKLGRYGGTELLIDLLCNQPNCGGSLLCCTCCGVGRPAGWPRAPGDPTLPLTALPRRAGMPCGVDARANEMMPHAVRSNRATNLFHTLKVGCVGVLQAEGRVSCSELFVQHVPHPQGGLGGRAGDCHAALAEA